MELSGCKMRSSATINATDNSEAPLLTEDDFAEIEEFANAGVLATA